MLESASHLASGPSPLPSLPVKAIAEIRSAFYRCVWLTEEAEDASVRSRSQFRVLVAVGLDVMLAPNRLVHQH